MCVCGKSFVGSNNALQSSIAELKESKIFAAKLHLMNVEIDWKFRPPAAPHLRGIWQRLVQIFKLSLYKVIGSRTLTDGILSTVSCGLEASKNNVNKHGKVRRVANASSVFQVQSLNFNLLKGPDLLSNFIGVILRSRENKIALSADIERVFMQVKVGTED